MRRILIVAGGKTGGHVFPAIAIAEGFVRQDPQIEVIFGGTGQGLEGTAVAEKGWSFVVLPTPYMKSRHPFIRLVALIRLPLLVGQTALLLRRLKPTGIIGIGGYGSGPVILAGWFLMIPTAIVEPNAIAGLANRWLGKCARRVFIAFEEARSFFTPKKVVYTGLPLRRHILEILSSSPSTNRGIFTIFCVGGSQGARRINQAVREALPLLGSMKGKVRFIHQVGTQDDLQGIRRAYEQAGLEVDVYQFIEDMASCYQAADLVIARAGAMTTAELAAFGKAVLFIPYAHAADNHQRANAMSFVKTGAAQMIEESELTGERLAAVLQEFVAHPDALARMGAHMLKRRRLDAADEMVKECLAFMVATHVS